MELVPVTALKPGWHLAMAGGASITKITNVAGTGWRRFACGDVFFDLPKSGDVYVRARPGINSDSWVLAADVCVGTEILWHGEKHVVEQRFLNGLRIGLRIGLHYVFYDCNDFIEVSPSDAWRRRGVWIRLCCKMH